MLMLTLSTPMYFSRQYCIVKASWTLKMADNIPKFEFISATVWPGSVEAHRDRPVGKGPWTMHHG